jgi:outer membrane protein TolC
LNVLIVNITVFNDYDLFYDQWSINKRSLEIMKLTKIPSGKRIGQGLILLILITTLIYPLQTFAQIKLTLDQAIELAVEKNYDAKKARLAVQKAEARKDEAIGNAFPTINIDAGYTNNLLKPKFFLPDFANPGSGQLHPVEIGATNAFKTSAKLTQILFNSAVFSGIGTAKIIYEASKEQYKSSLTKTISAVRKSFYGVLLAKELVNTFDTVLAAANRNLYVTEKMHQEGFVPEFDLIRARTSVKNLEPELLNAKLNYYNLLNLFKFNLGLDVSDSIELVGQIEIKNYRVPSLDSLMSILDDVNYDLKALALVQKVQERKINVYKSGYYPALYLFGEYRYEGQSNDWDFQTFNSASVGIGLSYTLFNGLQTTNQVEQAKVDFLTSVEQYKQTYNALKMKLTNAINKLETAHQKVKINEGNIERARRGFEISEVRYKEGTGSQVEINNAITALANAKLNYLKAAYDYLQATIELQELLGIVPEKYVNIYNDK